MITGTGSSRGRGSGGGGGGAVSGPACDASASMWLRLIGDYDAFITDDTQQSAQAGGGRSPEHAASALGAVRFDAKRAVAASSSQARPFLERLFQTQGFAGFLDQQTMPDASEHPDAALVDALLDRSKGEKPRLLADTGDLGHRTTTVILPPMSATVETAESLRAASEEGSVARLAVADVSMDDVLRCDAMETVLAGYVGRRRLYPDTMAEEAAALRARVGEPAEDEDPGAAGLGARGRAGSGNSSARISAARRRRSRAPSRPSLLGAGAASSDTSEEQGAAKPSVGWFARLFGAAGRAE